jgi:O-antigen/teichoic acid export membrane protein
MRDVGLITLARVIVIACQLANIKLFTSYLSIEQLGFYFFLLTLSYFVNALIFVPFDYYQQANLAKIIEKTGGVRPLLDLNLRLIQVYFLTVVGVVVVCSLFWHNYVYHILLAAALAIALYIVQAFRNTLNNLDYKEIVSYSLVQEAVIKITAFLLLVKYFHPNELLLMGAWLITLVFNVITLYFKAKNLGVFFCKEKHVFRIKEILHFSYPISVGALGNWVQLQGYRLILVPLGYAEVLGIFATITSIGSAGMGAVSTIFTQAFSPNIYKSNGGYTGIYIKNALILIATIVLCCLLFGDNIVRIATSPKFEPYWIILIIGVLVEAGNFLIGALTIHISLVGKTKQMMMASYWGIVVLVISFSIVFFTNSINAYSIGGPLVFAQLAVLVFIYRNYLKCSDIEDEKMEEYK